MEKWDFVQRRIWAKKKLRKKKRKEKEKGKGKEENNPAAFARKNYGTRDFEKLSPHSNAKSQVERDCFEQNIRSLGSETHASCLIRISRVRDVIRRCTWREPRTEMVEYGTWNIAFWVYARQFSVRAGNNNFHVSRVAIMLPGLRYSLLLP